MKIAMDISKRKGKEVQKAISDKDIEWQACFKELVEQVTSFSKDRYINAKIIAEVKFRIISCPSIAVLVRKEVVHSGGI
jgi:hypothetical protein